MYSLYYKNLQAVAAEVAAATAAAAAAAARNLQAVTIVARRTIAQY